MAFFDVFATGNSTFLGNFLEDKTKEKEFRYISGFLKDKKLEILEIGPGQGKLSKFFISNGYTNYDVVEPHDLMRNNLLSAGVRKAMSYSIPELQEKDESYDLIIVSDVFEHLNDFKEGFLFISEAYRVLKKGGKLFILSPDCNDWKMDFWNCDPSHNLVTTVRRLMVLYHDSKFKILDYQYNYACFAGLSGYLIGKFVKLITFWSSGNSLDSKPYKLRLTFLRRFLIIGEKE